MTKAQIERMAHDELERYGLAERGWRFQWCRAHALAGKCSYRLRAIAVSWPWAQVQTDVDAVRDTILHEVAHAIVGPGAGHGPVWQACAMSVGARPQRCVPAHLPRPRGNYSATCDACGQVFEVPRQRTRKYRCPCRRGGTLVFIRINKGA